MDNKEKSLFDTIKFKKEQDSAKTPHDVLEYAYNAMVEKGYDPVDQFVGYFLSEDPTYITSNRNARNVVTKMERYDLVEELVSFYISHNIKKGGKKFR